jgi:ferredoxin-NADP reductase/mono/diheme cytochrome c family protein
LIFVAAGCAAIWLIFDASRLLHDTAKRDRVLRAHRLAGYAFVALFCLMTWFMILKVRDQQEELSMRSMFHVLVALVLIPLLTVKIVIARRYRSYQSALVPLGLTIFVLGFVLASSTAGPYLFRRVTMKDISLQSINMGAARIDLRASEELMQKRCSRCHNLDRVVGARKDGRAWLETVSRMRGLPGSGISENDAKTILSYLLLEASIDSSTTNGELTVGKALVDTHCNRCHGLDRTYQSAKTPDEWKATVARMVNYARGTEGFFKPGEDERIIRFLSVTQTPDAFEKRRASVSRNNEDASTEASRAVSVDGAASRSIVPTVGVVLALTAVFGALLLRRPRPASAVAPSASKSTTPSLPLAPNNRKTLILELIRVERQTHDCVSLRFSVPEENRFFARPGQFLTFHWLLNGQKLVRSYSISSSPTQTGYVEITVKRQLNGIVSEFLNERAQRGLTVEAHGPAGQFYLDEGQHGRIVFFAGGSGITPIMSMLRYMDDRCCGIQAVLFYSVHTPQDIIFETELDRLSGRLADFGFVVIPTTAEGTWSGPGGRLTREMVLDHLSEPDHSTFFLCGPEPYMEHVKGILRSLNIGPEKIKQERFGGRKAVTDSTPALEGGRGSVEFTRSGKRYGIPAGRTLLEIAEMNGISIPYSCRQGQCGTCVTRLIDGETNMDCEHGLDPTLKAQGYILPCVARADGDVSLEA